MPANAAFDHITGRAETDFGWNQTKVVGNQDMDKEAFLKLLVAQLSNQDPLKPMEDKEFTAQLAEFSSLEQLTNISEGIESLNSGTERQDMLSAVSFIGKQVRAKGDGVSINGGQVSPVYFDVDQPTAGGFVNIYDANGNLLRSEQMGPRQPGTYEYQWDGLDYQGRPMTDGVYHVTMAAQNDKGTPVMIYTDVAGTVSGVQNVEGTQYLRLSDGRYVNLMEVKEVVNPSASQQPPADTEPDADSGSEESQS